MVSTYQQQLNNGQMGADGVTSRVEIGAMILKHLCNTSDRETVLQIQENKPLSSTDKSHDNGNDPPGMAPACEESPAADEIPHQGQLITDATACPQDIAYPTDSP